MHSADEMMRGIGPGLQGQVQVVITGIDTVPLHPCAVCASAGTGAGCLGLCCWHRRAVVSGSSPSLHAFNFHEIRARGLLGTTQECGAGSAMMVLH